MEWKLKEVMISGYSNTGDGGIIIDWTPGPEAESPTGRTDDVFNLVLPSVPLAVQDDGLLLPAVQTGGVSVACGDVNGDTSALGDPITFTYTVRNTSSAYEGTHALYQDVVIPSTAPEPGEVWDWNKKVMDGDIGGSIDFKPQLTSEPTAAEANGTGSFMIANVGDPAPVDYGTGSFIIQNVSDPATIDASLVFGSTGGDRSTVLLPYIEQHGGEANDGGFVIDWTATDSSSRGAGEVNHSEFSIVKLSDAASPKALDEISGPVDDLIGWEDDMGRSFDLVFPTQTAFEQREGNAVATESLEIAHEGFLGDHDDGWCMVVEISFPESGHALYDLVM